MNDFNKLGSLYNTISKDLKIVSFENETLVDFHNRIIYSAIGKWIMQLFADRDFEDEDIYQVSKAHVSLSAQNILSSYKKVDETLNYYFIDDVKLINEIENIYTSLGYINAGSYAFKYPIYKNKILFDNKTLVIDLDAKAKKMRGLGIWGKCHEDTDMTFEEFVFIKNDACITFKKFVSRLNYNEFDDNFEKVEIYNIDKNRWDYFNEKIIDKYEYHILKIDDGLDYKILKKHNNKIYQASVPSIYTKKEKDSIFKREIWRIILGLCAYNEKPVRCIISNFCGNGIKLSFKGYIFPFFEYAILKCMAWPLNDSNNINNFVTDSSMKSSICKLLKYLSIEIIEEGVD